MEPSIEKSHNYDITSYIVVITLTLVLTETYCNYGFLLYYVAL